VLRDGEKRGIVLHCNDNTTYLHEEKSIFHSGYAKILAVLTVCAGQNVVYIEFLIGIEISYVYFIAFAYMEMLTVKNWPCSQDV
jgi:hypothetical protein